tara:strand:+ start:2082 stop:3065 length:984 start_codon:yes stop_codon:yes gene_type:complete
LKDEFYISLVGEAFDGYSEILLDDKPAYIKHVSLQDQRHLHKYYEKYKTLALSKGLETEKERTAYVIEEGIWTQEDDFKISSLELEIENLKKTQTQLPLPSQREEMGNTIAERSAELAELTKDRREVIGKTAEEYAMSRSGDEVLRFLLFKDKKLTENLYTEKEFGELEAWEVAKINLFQSQIGERFSDAKIQEAVLRPFFSMYLSLCENVGAFYSKPITALSIYQLRVVLFGRMFFNIFQNTDDIPDNIKQDPEKLLAFSESQNNKDKRKTGIREDADASMVFGATAEDMKTLDAPQGNEELSAEAEKHGGQLNMEQMMRLAGHDV